MPRCFTCDYDPYAPSAFSTSVLSGSKAGAVRFRKALGDYYCPGCYTAILQTINISRKDFEAPYFDEEEAYIESIYTDAFAVPVREFE